MPDDIAIDPLLRAPRKIEFPAVASGGDPEEELTGPGIPAPSVPPQPAPAPGRNSGNVLSLFHRRLTR